MFFSVTHIKFEQDFSKGPQEDEQKILELRRLAERVRSKFKVCAAATYREGAQGSLGIAITALGSEEEKLSRLLDTIVDFCEQSGFGRVQDELSLVEDIDILDENDGVSL